jgi:hypothetical protein
MASLSTTVATMSTSNQDPIFREQAILLLKRQWELLEVIKRRIFEVPIICCTLQLGISAFAMTHDELRASMTIVVATSCALIGIAVLGVTFMASLHKLFMKRSDNIDYLYQQLDMHYSNAEYWPANHNRNKDDSGPFNRKQAAPILFILILSLVGYLVSAWPR